MTKNDLFELVLAANFLDIKPLFKLASVAVASQIYNLDVDQTREYLYIKNDWKPEEEKRVIAENEIVKEAYKVECTKCNPLHCQHMKFIHCKTCLPELCFKCKLELCNECN